RTEGTTTGLESAGSSSIARIRCTGGLGGPPAAVLAAPAAPATCYKPATAEIMAMGNDVAKRPTELINDREFIVDCCRFSEGTLTESQITQKYQLDAKTLDHLSKDDVLVATIELEKVRRIRNGQCAREKAQTHFATAPDTSTTSCRTVRHRHGIRL